MRLYFFVFLLLSSTCSTAFAQKDKWISFDSSAQKREINWSIVGYYGWHTAFFSKKPRRERGYSSHSNLGLDIKRQIRKNVFLCLINRYREDNYFLESPKFALQFPNFDVNNFTMTQMYSIQSHALAIEHRSVFKMFNLLVAGGMGVNFISSGSKHTGSIGTIADSIVSASSTFDVGQTGHNYFWLFNLGAEFPLLTNFYAHYNFSATYDFTQYYPILPFEVNTKTQRYILAPIPRKLNMYVQLGLSFRF